MAKINWKELPKAVKRGKGYKPDNVAALEKKFEVQLPSDLTNMLTQANGMLIKTKTGKITFLPYKKIFDTIVVQRSLFSKEKNKEKDDARAKPGKGVAQAWWSDGWIPFARINGGDLYCVDTTPGDGGKVGQIIMFRSAKANRNVVAPDLGTFLNMVMDKAGEPAGGKKDE